MLHYQQQPPQQSILNTTLPKHFHFKTLKAFTCRFVLVSDVETNHIMRLWKPHVKSVHVLSILWFHDYPTLSITVDRNNFNVKVFLSITYSKKIKHVKIFLCTIIRKVIVVFIMTKVNNVKIDIPKLLTQTSWTCNDIVRLWFVKSQKLS